MRMFLHVLALPYAASLPQHGMNIRRCYAGSGRRRFGNVALFLMRLIRIVRPRGKQTTGPANGSCW